MPTAQAKQVTARTNPKESSVSLHTETSSPLGILPLDVRRAALEEGAQEAARLISSDVVRQALRQSGKTLRQIQSETGLDPAMISRIATGRHKSGPHVWSLMAIAQALDLDLKITIE